MSRVDRYEYDDWKNFGIRTKKYREEIGISKEKFAEMINRSENYISYLEKGKTSASVHTLHQISKALKVSTDSILYGEIDKDKDYFPHRMNNSLLLRPLLLMNLNLLKQDIYLIFL